MGFSSEFLSEMTHNAVGMTMRTKEAEIEKLLAKDIIYPEFYHEYGEFDHMEVTMG